MSDRIYEALQRAHEAVFNDHFDAVAASQALFRALQALVADDAAEDAAPASSEQAPSE